MLSTRTSNVLNIRKKNVVYDKITKLSRTLLQFGIEVLKVKQFIADNFVKYIQAFQ